jgi:carboxyl-terminal processing protease
MLRSALLAVLIGTAPAAAGAADYAALFDEAVSLVREQFYDAKLNGLDWPALAAQQRARLAPDMDREAFAAVVNDLLGRLGASHTALLTRDTPDWYHLAGVFADGHAPLREALEKAFGDGATLYTGIGILSERRAAGSFVTGVLQGFPAEAAGVLLPEPERVELTGTAARRVRARRAAGAGALKAKSRVGRATERARGTGLGVGKRGDGA